MKIFTLAQIFSRDREQVVKHHTKERFQRQSRPQWSLMKVQTPLYKHVAISLISRLPVVIPPYKEMVTSWNIHVLRKSHFETQTQMYSLPIKPKVKCLLHQVMD